MSKALLPEEIRVLGCLLEKAVTTPDQFPLTLNALVSACNQKSSRDPVMQLDQGEVQRAVRMLEEQHLVTSKEDFRSRVVKFDQRWCNTPFASVQLNPAEYALMTLLLLRGPQTAGELKARSGRLHTFADNNDVLVTLRSLEKLESGALVTRLAMRPGRRDHEYCHLLGDQQAVPAAESAAPVSREPAASGAGSGSGRTGSGAQTPVFGRAAALELRVTQLEAQMAVLLEQLGVEPLGDTLEDTQGDSN